MAKPRSRAPHAMTLLVGALLVFGLLVLSVLGYYAEHPAVVEYWTRGIVP